jgi:hypothetical protein
MPHGLRSSACRPIRNEDGLIIETQASRLLGDVDVDRRAGEDGGDYELELASERKPREAIRRSL